MKKIRYVKKLKKKLSYKVVKDKRIRKIIRSIPEEDLIVLSNLLPLNQNIPKNNLMPSYDFLKLSKDDLLACKILCNNDILHFAVYHLQQSVEKLAKAYGLASGYISINKLRSDGHVTPYVFIKLLQEDFLQKLLEVFENVHEFNEIKISKLKKLFSKEKTLEEIALFNKKIIDNWLEVGKNIRKNLKEKGNEIKSTIEKIDKEVWKISQLTLKEKEKIHELLTSLNIPLLLEVVSNLIMLYILSVITFPHSSFTRYPDGNVKPTHYKKGLGIVDCLDEIVKETEYCIRVLEEFLIASGPQK